MMPTPPAGIEPDDRVLATALIPYRHDFAVESTSAVTGTVEGALPAGIRVTTSPTNVSVIGATLVLSGTPRKPGTYVFTLVATNLFGSSKLRGHAARVATTWIRRERRRHPGSSGRGTR